MWLKRPRELARPAVRSLATGRRGVVAELVENKKALAIQADVSWMECSRVTQVCHVTKDESVFGRERSL